MAEPRISMTGTGFFPLLKDLRARPGLLLMELGWRWSCGSFLLLLGGFAAWRVWTAAVPALTAAGAFSLTFSTFLDAVGDPAPLLALAAAVLGILLPPLLRSALGLLPLALMCWVTAFTCGRGAVLARHDPRLPKRPWLLAGCKCFAMLGGLAICGLWCLLAVEGTGWFAQFTLLSPLLYMLYLLLLTWLAMSAWSRLSVKVQVALALGLLEPIGTVAALRRAFQGPGAHMAERAALFRKAARKTRFRILWPAFIISLLPSPFLSRWALLVWYAVLSVVPLVATDAVKLGEMFALLRGVRDGLEARARAMPEVPLEKIRI